MALATRIAIHFDLAIRTLLYAWYSAARLSQATLLYATKTAHNHAQLVKQLVERLDCGPEHSWSSPFTTVIISSPGDEIYNMTGGVADERAPRCSSRPNPCLAILEATLALHAERRLGLGRKAAVPNRLLAHGILVHAACLMSTHSHEAHHRCARRARTQCTFTLSFAHASRSPPTANHGRIFRPWDS